MELKLQGLSRTFQAPGMGPSNEFSWSQVFVKFVILNDFTKGAPSQIVGASSPTTRG